MTAEDVAWILSLKEVIWKKSDHLSYGRETYFENRQMSDEEWSRLLEVIRCPSVEDGFFLVLNPVGCCMGFGMGLWLCRDETYPGVGQEKKALILISQDHIPKSVLTQAGCKYDKARFDDAWKILSPFTHGDANAKLLAQFGFEQLKGPDHYDY